uniref:ATP-dependent DNA helicase n=1 Tax=Nicotiana sylvestris TaxID=4096 RepID=A0A1U7XKG4_NICSY|nr:PREDICTED: ATP-dependent DNA helicase PIF3-like [Nicotiana sylvestris]
MVINHINDILHSMGGDINEYHLIPEAIRSSIVAKDAKEVYYERIIIVTEEDILLHKKLNEDQLKAYNVITDRIFSNKVGAFFIDGLGGTGKTFLYRTLLATIRSKGYIALTTATSGVAASILSGGRTAHSCFKIPINIDKNVTCNISKQSSLACLIQDAKLIIWDEVSMAKKRMIELLDLLLNDLMDSTILFGGKVVAFGGDFRQTLSVVRNREKEDFINESFLYYHIWEELERLRLFENMRAKYDPSFCNYLLRVGNGKEKVTSTNKIEIPASFIVPYTTEKESLDKLFTITYPDLHTFFSSSSCTSSHVILTTKNDFVDEINDMLVTRFPEEAKTFVGIDETIEPTNQSRYEDLLHSLNPPDIIVVVVKCGSVKYIGANNNKCREISVIDTRARFEVVMTDSSGSVIATLIGELGEKFLDMSAADICEIISVKKQPLPLEHVRQRLTHRLFKIQLRKIFSRTSDMQLFIVSYFVKEDLFQLPGAVASEEIGESSNTLNWKMLQ